MPGWPIIMPGCIIGCMYWGIGAGGAADAWTGGASKVSTPFLVCATTGIWTYTTHTHTHTHTHARTHTHTHERALNDRLNDRHSQRVSSSLVQMQVDSIIHVGSMAWGFGCRDSVPVTRYAP